MMTLFTHRHSLDVFSVPCPCRMLEPGKTSKSWSPVFLARVYDARLGYDETLGTHATASALNLAGVHANNSSSSVDVSWTQVERRTAFMKRLPSDLRHGPDCQLKSFSFYLLMLCRLACNAGLKFGTRVFNYGLTYYQY